MITFGQFGLLKKTKTENLKGTEYRLYFEDEYGNKITVKAEGADYREFEVGDPFNLDSLQVQSRLS